MAFSSNNAVAGDSSNKIDDDLKPICFICRGLTKCQKNYNTLKREASAIVFSATKLK